MAQGLLSNDPHPAPLNVVTDTQERPSSVKECQGRKKFTACFYKDIRSARESGGGPERAETQTRGNNPKHCHSSILLL